MKRFELHRTEDVTGVSGVGVVAEGIMFSDHSVALRWKTKYRSTAIYHTFDDMYRIHTHHGSTKVVWLDSLEGGE